MNNTEIKVGTRVKFDPFQAFTADGYTPVKRKDGGKIVQLPRKYVEGTVVFVNVRHGWFSVEYQLEGVQRTSFDFSQIGQEVKICDRR